MISGISQKLRATRTNSRRHSATVRAHGAYPRQVPSRASIVGRPGSWPKARQVHGFETLHKRQTEEPESVTKIPRVLFVLGKGGTGRSSVAAALGSCFAARGENTLIVEWTFSEAIAPWFGQPPAGHEARELRPRLSVMNFSLDSTLREYFVGHLKLR